MNALGIHALFFAAAVAVGCAVLSVCVRVMARHMTLSYRAPNTLRLGIAYTGVALSGLLGQVCFLLLQDLGSLPARLVGWLVAGVVATIATARATPYMPLRRSALVGGAAGFAGWLAFTLLLPYSESLARIGSVLAFWGTLPLAVLFPLASSLPAFLPCHSCSCGRVEDDAEDTGGTVPLPAPPFADLWGDAARPAAPGRVAVPGRVPFSLRRGAFRQGK